MVKKIDGIFSNVPMTSRYLRYTKEQNMTTLQIPNTPLYATLIGMIEEVMKPDQETIQAFTQKLNASELALLFSAIEGNCGSSSTKKSAKSATSSKVVKAPRNQIKAADDVVRCEALVFAYDLNAEGNLIPSRCKRCIEGDTKFCKQHGAPDGKPWKGKQRGELDTIAEFKWQHLGTVTAPSPIFELEKAKAELLKNFNAKQSAHVLHSSECSDDDTNTMKKTVKGAKEPKQKKTAKADKEPKQNTKPKRRVANGYIFYKSLKHQEIKLLLILENPEMKGKELANKITSVASEQWKQLSESDQTEYKNQAKIRITSMVDASDVHEEMDDGEDTPVSISSHTPKATFTNNQSDEEGQTVLEMPDINDEDDEDTLVFNEKHNVWVDTDNNLCYETKDTNPGPIGQVQRGQLLRFPASKK